MEANPRVDRAQVILKPYQPDPLLEVRQLDPSRIDALPHLADFGVSISSSGYGRGAFDTGRFGLRWPPNY